MEKKGFAKRQRFSKENIKVYHEKTYVLLNGRGLAKNK